MPDVKKLVLVVDDEELNVDMLSRRLMRSGYEVHTAVSGAKALALVADNDYDVVLLDHMMPNLSGREVLSRLRSTFTPEALPVIMVTAVAESDKIADALGAGANDYITKPIDYRVALARIQTQIARKEAERALRHSEERYALAAKASRDGLWDWNLETDEIYYSPRWIEMNGLGTEGRIDAPNLWFTSLFPADLTRLQACLEQHLTGLQEWFSCHYRVQHPDGSLRWMTTRGVITRNTTGRATRLSGSQSDVTEERTLDPLTHLPNRVALHSALEAVFLRESRHAYKESLHALIFLDLDGFKAVNDSLGHLAGDGLLRDVAVKLRAVAVQYAETTEAVEPIVARMSGDEFAILISSPCAMSDAENLARHIQQRMREPIVLGGTPVHVAFSIGIAPANAEHHRYEELIYDADMAMYAAKAQGRGSLMLFTPELRRSSLDRLELENDLRNALSRNELFLVYQPKIRLQDGSIYGVEALIRWQHPTRGLINPGQFIPMAEETGCIIEIGYWVLRSACTQLMIWQQQYPLSPALELSVNLSPREFKQHGLIEKIAAVIRETGFPPASLHLEITEGVLFENMQRARASLQAIKELGIGLELDDFGSGYSSLRYLRELPFDTLKIDRYFLSSLDTDPAGASKMLETIVAMAGNLEMKVIAEGIEKAPQSQLLRAMGCNFGQGFLFSRPVPAFELEGLLENECALRTQQFRPKQGPRSVADEAPSFYAEQHCA